MHDVILFFEEYFLFNRCLPSSTDHWFNRGRCWQSSLYVWSFAVLQAYDPRGLMFRHLLKLMKTSICAAAPDRPLTVFSSFSDQVIGQLGRQQVLLLSR